MADITKTLNTRLKLKIDTLENWNKSTVGLLAGELAIATVAASAGTGLTEPVCMIKIGEDGVKTFKDLSWNFYAKASDVLEAAKDATKLTAFINGVIADADMTTNEKFTELAGKVDTLNGDESTAGSVAKAIKDAIDALDLANTYVVKEDGKSLMTDAERTKLADISEGANKVESSENGKIKIDGVDTIVYVHPDKHTIDDVTGLQDALDGKSDDDHKHVAADITDLDTTIQAKYATKDEAKGYADAKDEAIAEAKEAGTDAAAALKTYKDEMTTVLAGKQDVIPENTYDAHGAAAQALEDAKKYADENDADTKYGIEYDSVNKKIKLVSDTSKTEIDAAAFIKDGMVNNVEIKGGNLVITFNTDAGKDAINVPLESLVDVYTGVDGTTIKVDVSSDDKISAEVKTGSIKDGHIASDAAIAKSKLASDVQTSLGLADSAIQEKDIADLRSASHTHTFNDADVKDAITKKHSHNFSDEAALSGITAAKIADWDDAVSKEHTHSFVESELDKIKDGDVAKWNAAEQNAKDYADDQIEALDLGTMSKETATDYVKKSEAVGYNDILTKTEAQSAYQQKGDYATAAQGVKADTALQKITTTENNGLKVTNNNNIDIDDNIVFILDCGDSGVTA